MGISELSVRNFATTGSTKKFMQLVGVPPSPAVVFFKSDNCAGSRAFEPEFYQLASGNDMFYGILNISRNRDVPMMSKGTSTEITGVPMVIFYADGFPRIKFRAKSLTIRNIQYEVRKWLSQGAGQPPPGQPGGYPPQHPSQQGYPPQHPSNVYPQAQPTNSQHFVQPQFNMAHQGAPQRGKSSGTTQGYYYPSELGQPTENIRGHNFDQDYHLEIPKNVTPYNTPWVNDLKSQI